MPGTAFSPANWTGYDEQSVTNPSSALTDFTLLIDISTLSSTWKSMVQSDGGDIRLTKEDGTELPFDIIDWAYVASQPSGFILVEWSGTLAASGVQKIRVWAGYTGGTAVSYGASETYGQYNAYGPHNYFSLDGAVNRVDGTAPTLSGVTPGNVPAQVGSGTSFDGAGDWITTNVAGPSSNLTMYCWALQNGGTYSDAITVEGSGGTSRTVELRVEQWNNTGKLGFTLRALADYTSILDSPTSLSFCGVSATSGTDVKYRVNGSTDSDSIGSFTTGVDILLGRDAAFSSQLNGTLNYIGVCDGALGDAWLQEVYLQTNDQATFWGTWAWTAAGGNQRTTLGPHVLPMPFSDAYAPKSGVPTPVTGSFTATANLSSAALSGLTINVGTLSAVAGLSAAAFTGLVPRVGTMAATADKSQTDMSGVVINIGDGTVSAPLCRFSGTGVTATDPPRVGDFEVMANQASAAMTGVVQQIGDFEALANASAAAFTGAVVRVGQFAKPAALSSAVLSGAVQNIGQFTALSSLSGAFLLGSRTRVGSFAVVSAGGVSLSGDVTNIGSFSAVSSTSRFTGTGGNTVSATVVNADATHQVTDGPLIAAGILDSVNAQSAAAVARAGRGLGQQAFYTSARVTRAVSGKRYVEFTHSGGSIDNDMLVGLVDSTFSTWTTWVGNSANSYSLGAAGNYYNGGSPADGTFSAITAGQTLMVAFDADALQLWFGLADTGVWFGSGNPAAGTNPVYTPAAGTYYFAATTGFGGQDWTFNAGQRPFVLDPPSGFLALGDF